MEKISLFSLPTPLQPLDVEQRNEYYIKRDDLIDFAMGGNKARKIEFFLQDALSQEADTLVTYGSATSNHCRLVAAAAVRYGLKCHLIYEDSQYTGDVSGNLLICNLLGAGKVWCKVSEVAKTINEQLSVLRKNGYKPYFIQGGGHGNLGTHAYVEAYNELSKQAKGFDYIFLASGTGTTQAGLLCGSELAKGKEKVVGISIAREREKGSHIIMECIQEYMAATGNTTNIKNDAILFLDDYIPKKGNIDDNIADTIATVLRKNSILLDPVYTGRAFFGMKEYIMRSNIQGKKILFWHTGGQPLFFQMADRLQKYI